jgi:hypothetical protein
MNLYFCVRSQNNVDPVIDDLLDVHSIQLEAKLQSQRMQLCIACGLVAKLHGSGRAMGKPVDLLDRRLLWAVNHLGLRFFQPDLGGLGLQNLIRHPGA